MKRPRFDPWVGKIPFRRAWQPTPVFLPGKFHRQRSLAGYSTWGRRELDTVEQLTHTHTHTHTGMTKREEPPVIIFEDLYFPFPYNYESSV